MFIKNMNKFLSSIYILHYLRFKRMLSLCARMQCLKGVEMESPFIMPVNLVSFSELILTCLSLCPPVCLVLFSLQAALFQIFWCNFIHWRVLAQGQTLLEMDGIISLFQPLPI